jgi:hypothetical protein
VADLGPTVVAAARAGIPAALYFARLDSCIVLARSRQIVHPSATSMCCLHAAHFAPRGSNFDGLDFVAMSFVLRLSRKPLVSAAVRHPSCDADIAP